MNNLYSYSARFLFCVCCAMFPCSVLSAQDRVADLEKLMREGVEIKETGESLQQKYKQLQNRYDELDNKIVSLSRQIKTHEDHIHSLQRQKQTNNNDKKGKNKTNDRQADMRLEQQIKEEQQKISKIKEQQAPLKDEAGKIRNEGTETAKKIEKEVEKLAHWRIAWGFQCDLDLSDASQTHEKNLSSLEKHATQGKHGESWQLAHAAALAGTTHYAEALKILEPLVKDNFWRAKATALRAYIYALQGDVSKAEGEFDRGVKLDNRDPHYYLLRSKSMGLFGKWYDAKRHADNAHELAPQAVAVLSWKATVYAYQSNPIPTELKTALELAQGAVKQTQRQDWVALDALSAVQAASGDFDAATSTQTAAVQVAIGSNKELCQKRLQAYRKQQLPVRETVKNQQ